MKASWKAENSFISNSILRQAYRVPSLYVGSLNGVLFGTAGLTNKIDP